MPKHERKPKAKKKADSMETVKEEENWAELSGSDQGDDSGKGNSIGKAKSAGSKAPAPKKPANPKGLSKKDKEDKKKRDSHKTAIKTSAANVANHNLLLAGQQKRPDSHSQTSSVAFSLAESEVKAEAQAIEAHGKLVHMGYLGKDPNKGYQQTTNKILCAMAKDKLPISSPNDGKAAGKPEFDPAIEVITVANLSKGVQIANLSQATKDSKDKLSISGGIGRAVFMGAAGPFDDYIVHHIKLIQQTGVQITYSIEVPEQVPQMKEGKNMVHIKSKRTKIPMKCVFVNFSNDNQQQSVPLVVWDNVEKCLKESEKTKKVKRMHVPFLNQIYQMMHKWGMEHGNIDHFPELTIDHLCHLNACYNWNHHTMSVLAVNKGRNGCPGPLHGCLHGRNGVKCIRPGPFATGVWNLGVPKEVEPPLDEWLPQPWAMYCRPVKGKPGKQDLEFDATFRLKQKSAKTMRADMEQNRKKPAKAEIGSPEIKTGKNSRKHKRKKDDDSSNASGDGTAASDIAIAPPPQRRKTE